MMIYNSVFKAKTTLKIWRFQTAFIINLLTQKKKKFKFNQLCWKEIWKNTN